jgi:hypothetical protein
VYIGEVFLAKTSAIATDYILALATLGDKTQIDISICVKSPKVTKTRRSVWCDVSAVNFSIGQSL